jgi:UDP-3-O-[3-hydroxymyristoyl] glucosamine N-acyltransferase
VGADVCIYGLCTLDNPQPKALGFIKAPDAAIAEQVQAFTDTVFLVPVTARGVLTTPHIAVTNPRSAFAQVVNEYFLLRHPPRIAPTASIAPDAVLGTGVTVGEFSVVGAGACIGDDTELRHHVVVGPGVQIGKRCLVKSNTVIGEEGFGIDRDEQGNNIRVPHLGSVIIGDDVELGALNTVCSGTIDPTVVCDFVKTDDHVHIAHNCRIGANSIITGGNAISGSVTLERDVWIAPNCSIMNGITIGERAYVGLGAVVLENCDANSVYAGVPAKKLRNRSNREGTAA